MRWARYRDGERVFWGSVEGDHVLEGVGDLFRGWRPNGHTVQLSAVRLLAPAAPTKIVGVGLNYRSHAEEMGKPLPAEPLLFLKPPSAVIGPGDAIRLPASSKRIDYEGELGVVIGRRCRAVEAADAADCVLGYTCFLDVSARDFQKSDVQFTRAKGFDTFAPIGPWVETGVDPSDLAIETFVNGERRQASRTSDLVFGVFDLVAFVSSVMTLEPGDVIATGTPSGVGPLVPDDVVEVKIEGVGSLRCPVEAA